MRNTTRLQWNKPGKRILASVLAFLMMMQCFLFCVALPTEAEEYAAVKGSVDTGNVNIKHQQSLSDNGDGTYTLTVDFTTSGAYNDRNLSQTVARNNYFTATYSGYYLVELWGGDGASGETTAYSEGGTGGDGGHIYGVVKLEKGDTLFYTLGGHGSQTESTNTGGGVNGDGGHHGELGSSLVGGGGGYSAVFKFNAEDGFEEAYLDDKGNVTVATIQEADRLSKYIMIAGGGGGGGAGNGWFFSQDATGTPDGGAGGNMSSRNGTVGNGYFFAGSDGKSSGTSVDYIGHGGTDVPGTIEDTLLTWFEGKQPNDWTGTTNPSYTPGAGGSGNFRGGGGGGGYAGGSGGVMTEFIVATNIGGGGGGSSYIAADIYEQTVYGYEDYADKLRNTNPSSTGGAVVITHLDALSEETEAAMAAFRFAGSVSQYFTIEDITVSDTAVLSGDLASNAFSVAGNIQDNDVSVTMTLKRKDTFTGGNNVPLFDSVDCYTGDLSCGLDLGAQCSYVNVPLNFGITTYTHMTEDPNAAFTEAQLYDNESGVWESMLGYGTFATATGYTVEHAGTPVTAFPVQPGVNGTGKYVYNVSYTVSAPNDNVAAVGEPVPAETVISAEAIVTIIVGQIVKTENGADLVLTKKLSFENGVYTLSLNVMGSISGTVPATTAPAQLPAQVRAEYAKTDYSDNPYVSVADGVVTYTVPASGYYMVQAWGGDGGHGSGYAYGSRSSPGGEGGAGGYLKEYLYLNAGERLMIANGADGTGDTTIHSASNILFKTGTAGNGGNGTTVTLSAGQTNTTLMIAGGGGGGGAGWIQGSNSGQPASYGESAYQEGTTFQNTTDGDNNTPAHWSNEALSADATANGNGTSGQAFADSAAAGLFIGFIGPGNRASGGNAGTSYVNTAKVEANTDSLSAQTVKDSFNNASADAYVNNGGGAVYVTCLEMSNATVPAVDTAGIAAKEAELAGMLSGYALSGTFSQYFDSYELLCSGVNTQDGEGNSIAPVLTTQTAEGTSNVDFTVSGVQPTVTHPEHSENADCSAVAYATIDYTIAIRFKPKEGFLGGNDVPVLAEVTAGEGESVQTDSAQIVLTQGSEAILIDRYPEADYANVEIPSLNAALLTVNNPTYVLGTEALTPEAVFTWTGDPTGGVRDWRSDYATVTGPVCDPEDLTPTVENQTVNITVSVAPNTQTAEKGVVIPSVSGNSISKTAAVNVVNRIVYSLSNMTTNHAAENVNGNDYYTHPLDVNYAAVLSPAAGYLLPEMITVEAGGRVLTDGEDYVYYSDTGEVLIYADSINNRNVYIYASGAEQEYTISFISQDAPELSKVFTYTANADISEAVAYFNSAMPAVEKEGYTFTWEWDGIGEEEEIPTVMPASNQWVIGRYFPDEYTLTINYYKLDADGNKTDESAAGSYVGTVSYDETYSVLSPQVDGYLAEVIEVTGTVGQEDLTDGNISVTTKDPNVEGSTNSVTVNVYYRPTVNGLTVVYTYADGYAATVVENYEVATDESFSRNLTTVRGYTIYTTKEDTATESGNVLTSVSGIMDSDGEVFYVYYRPNTYTVTYQYEDLGNTATDADDKVVTVASEKVLYHKEYGYDPDSQTYGALPEPNVRTGYVFGGWYLTEDFSGDPVKAETIVDTVGNHTLYGKWTIQSFKITVNYLYEDGSSAAPTVSETLEYGTAYQYVSPEIEGFVPDRETVSGTMSNQNVVITVSYLGKPYTLTIKYLNADGTEAFPAYTATVRYKQAYSVKSPAKEGYGYQEIVSGEMPNQDVTLEVVYRSQQEAEQTIISVTIEWGNLTFGYDYGTWNPEKHIYEDSQVIAPENNTITVTSNIDTNVEVVAKFTYQDRGVYPFDVFFTRERLFDRDAKLLTPITLRGDPASETRPSEKVYVWVDGKLPNGYEGKSMELGQCAVAISAGASIE